MFAHKKLLVIIILIVLLTMIFPNQHSYKLPNVKGATVVNHWTFSDSSVHLSYDVTEYQDASFVIKEYYWGSLSRTIRGRAYIDIVNGQRWAKAVVDSNTTAYWDAVRSDYRQKQLINSGLAFINVIIICLTNFDTIAFIEYLKKIASPLATATALAKEYIDSNSGLTNDTTKTIYEMACASEAAWHLVNNPHVIIPSWNNQE